MSLVITNETSVSNPVIADDYQPMLDAMAELAKRSVSLGRARTQFNNAKGNAHIAFGIFCAEVAALCERKTLEDVSDYLLAREDKFHVPASGSEYKEAALNKSNVQRLRDAHDFSLLGGVDGDNKPRATAAEMFPFTSFSNSAKDGVDLNTFRKQFIAALKVNADLPADDQKTVVKVAATVKEDIKRAHAGITSEDATIAEFRRLVQRLQNNGATLSPAGIKTIRQMLNGLVEVTDDE